MTRLDLLVILDASQKEYVDLPAPLTLKGDERCLSERERVALSYTNAVIKLLKHRGILTEELHQQLKFELEECNDSEPDAEGFVNL